MEELCSICRQQPATIDLTVGAPESAPIFAGEVCSKCYDHIENHVKALVTFLKANDK
jgi:hypothetical protein